MRILKPTIILMISLLLFRLTSSARVLGVFPFPSRSHGILGSQLLKGLAKRGHQVTMLSSYPLDKPHENYTDLVISLNSTRPAYETIMNKKQGWAKITSCYNSFAKISEALYSDQAVLQLINSTQKFDVIIYLHLTQFSFLGLSHKFNASTVLFSIVGPNHLMAYTMNTPQTSSHVSHFFLGYGEKMSFWERAHNLFINTIGYLQLAFVNEPMEKKLLQNYFPTAPTLSTLVDNIQLVLLNSHVVLEPMRPIFQNMINIGGFYMEEGTPLPDHVQEFLDGSQHGVIYIGFGSNIRSEHLTPEAINIFLDTFKQLSFDILWKLDVDLPGIPPNVKIVNWLPQTSVLSHDKVKVFVSHAGKGGINEAIYFGVPMLLFPLYADQAMNARESVDGGIALTLDFYEFTREDFSEALHQLIHTEYFKENIMQRSSLIRNPLVHPMDEVNYWIEYLAKNGNVKFLQSVVTSMPWYKLMMFDVFAVVGLLVVLFVWLFWFLTKKLLSFCRLSSRCNAKIKMH